jgi:hypothetical protein
MLKKLLRFSLILYVLLPSESPAQLRWERFGELTVPRAMHSACALDADRVIVIGGRTSGDQTTNSTDVINLESGIIEVGPSMEVPRSQFALVRLSDTRILVAGGYTHGYDSNTDLIEVLDVKSMKWRTIGRLREARGQFAAIALDSEQVLVVGGRIGQSNVRATSEIINASSGASISVQDFPYPTEGTRLIRTLDGSILAFSGRSGGPGSFRSDVIHRFNVERRVWEKAGFVSDSLYLPVVTKLDDGGYLWTGGSFAESDSKSTFSSTICVLDGRSFIKIGDMTRARVQHCCTQVSDSICVATGGQDDWKNPQLTCDLINVYNGSSRPGPPMNVSHSRHDQVDVEIDGIRSCLVIGGYDSTSITPVIEILRDGCPDGVIDEPLDISALNFVGSATPLLGVARLTSAQTYQSGAVWLKAKKQVVSGFMTTFVFRLSQGNDGPAPDGGPKGADGIALVIQNEGSTVVGGVGGGIGYEGLPHGVAIEFDTYLNSVMSDVAGSHIGVQVGNGTVLSSNHQAPFLRALTHDGVPPLAADGTLYFAKVEYSAGVLKIWLDLDGSFDKPLVELPIDLARELSLDQRGDAWVGLTSSTGLSSQVHELVAWHLGECESVLTSIFDIDQPALSSTISFSPIPATDHVQIAWSRFGAPISIKGYSLDGRLVFECNPANASESWIRIDMSGYEAGVYVIATEWPDRVERKLLPIIR